MGGWLDGTFGAEIALLLDGVEINFGADGNLYGWAFFGVIDTEGFTSFEFREMNGKGGQAVYVFADDFTIGVVGIADMVWDYCLNIECPDCGVSYQPRQLRINLDLETSTFNGIVQAQDNSFGSAASGALMGDSALFSFWASDTRTLHFFNINLSTLTGVTQATRYDYNSNVPYDVLATMTTNLVITSCPAN